MRIIVLYKSIISGCELSNWSYPEMDRYID